MRAQRTIDDVEMSPFLRKIVLFSSGGSFLDGYALSIIGVALVQLGPALGLTATDQAMIGAASLAGIFVGSILAGRLTDGLGRRTMFILDVTAIGATSLASVFVASPWQLIVLRLLLGFFVGADYPIATSLITEFVPRRARATGMGVVSIAWYVGATAAAFVGFALVDVASGWRWMLGSAALPCVFLLVGRRDIPESPRWLARRGRIEAARATVHRVYGEDVELDDEQPVTTRFAAVFRAGYARRVVYLGVLILCQVVPMYAMYTFGPQILEAFGLGSDRMSILGEALISVFFIVGSIPAMFWLNSLGRRPLLIGSLALMAVGLLIPGVAPAAPAEPPSTQRPVSARSGSTPSSPAARASCSGCTRTSCSRPRSAPRRSAWRSRSAASGSWCPRTGCPCSWPRSGSARRCSSAPPSSWSPSCGRSSTRPRPGTSPSPRRVP